MKKLQSELGKDIDVHPLVSLCTLDVICGKVIFTFTYILTLYL